MRIRATTLKTGSPLPDRHTTADAAKKPCREYSFLWNYARLLGWKSTYFAYKKGGISIIRGMFFLKFSGGCPWIFSGSH